jgi:MFS family permease
MSIAMAAMAPVAGVTADAIGRRAPALVGAAIALVGALAVLAELDEGTGFGYLAASLALLGLGIGLGTGPATTAAVESAPRSAAGGAAGTNSMMRYAGSILGAGLLAGILDTDGAAPGLDTFRVVMLLVVAMLGVAVLASTRIHRFPPEAGARGTPPARAPASVNTPNAR